MCINNSVVLLSIPDLTIEKPVSFCVMQIYRSFLTLSSSELECIKK